MASTVVRLLTGSTATKNERDFAHANAPTGKGHRNRTRTQYFDLCPYAEACGIAASLGTQTCSVSLKLSNAGPKVTANGRLEFCLPHRDVVTVLQNNLNSPDAHHKKIRHIKIMSESITSYLSPKESPI